MINTMAAYDLYLFRVTVLSAMVLAPFVKKITNLAQEKVTEYCFYNYLYYKY